MNDEKKELREWAKKNLDEAISLREMLESSIIKNILTHCLDCECLTCRAESNRIDDEIERMKDER